MLVIPHGTSSQPTARPIMSQAIGYSSPTEVSPRRTRPFVNRIPEDALKRRGSKGKNGAAVMTGRAVLASAKTVLRWGDTDVSGVSASGWNPFKGANVCFMDESATKEKISLIIEPPAPGTTLTVASIFCIPYWPIICQAISAKSEAHGYFFEKNPTTGTYS